MSPAHTPGPWRIGRSGPNECPTIGTDGGLMVAMVCHGVDHPTDANARLIAAAPEMLSVIHALAGCPDAMVALARMYGNDLGVFKLSYALRGEAP